MSDGKVKEQKVEKTEKTTKKVVEPAPHILDVEGIIKGMPKGYEIAKKGKINAVLKIEKNQKGQPYFSHTKDFGDALNKKVIGMIQDAKARAYGRGAKRLSPSDI